MNGILTRDNNNLEDPHNNLLWLDALIGRNSFQDQNLRFPKLQDKQQFIDLLNQQLQSQKKADTFMEEEFPQDIA